tara:strand:+ start:241 stop:1014 length:774 start_codon:yes stop_codon:yes gene_type:complete
MNTSQDYIIAIPTYNRPNIIIKKTLKLLKEYDIPNDKIIIFVKDQEQMNLYKDIILNYNLVLTGASGIMETRNTIQAFFYYETSYTNVVYIDDDISGLYNMDKKLDNLDSFITKAFIDTKELGYNLWGVSALHNPFYMSEKTTTNAKYICGAFFGEIFDRDKYPIFADVGHFEDHQKSMDHFIRDGGVVKFNWIGIDTKYFGVGGINDSLGGLENRKIDMYNNGLWLEEKYPGLCKQTEKKWGYDLRINYRFKLNKY